MLPVGMSRVGSWQAWIRRDKAGDYSSQLRLRVTSEEHPIFQGSDQRNEGFTGVIGRHRQGNQARSAQGMSTRRGCVEVITFKGFGAGL